MILVHFSLKIWHLVAPILLIFLRIKLTRVYNSEIRYTKNVFSWQGVCTHPTHLVCLRHWRHSLNQIQIKHQCYWAWNKNCQSEVQASEHISDKYASNYKICNKFRHIAAAITITIKFFHKLDSTKTAHNKAATTNSIIFQFEMLLLLLLTYVPIVLFHRSILRSGHIS